MLKDQYAKVIIGILLSIILLMSFVYLFEPPSKKSEESNESSTFHGSYICYKDVDSSGQIVLKEARTEVENNKEIYSIKPTIVDYCSFTPPLNAEEFKFLVVGAGGVGGESRSEILIDGDEIKESNRTITVFEQKDGLEGVIDTNLIDEDFKNNSAYQNAVQNLLKNFGIRVSGGDGATSTVTQNKLVAPHCDGKNCYALGGYGATCEVDFSPKFGDVIEYRSGIGGKFVSGKDISVPGENGSVIVKRNGNIVLEVVAHGGLGSLYKNFPCRYDANGTAGPNCKPVILPNIYNDNLSHVNGNGKCEIKINKIAANVIELTNAQKPISKVFSSGDDGKAPIFKMSDQLVNRADIVAKRVAIKSYVSSGADSGKITEKMLHYLSNEGKPIIIPKKYIGESKVGGTDDIPCGEPLSRTTCVGVNGKYVVAAGGSDGVSGVTYSFYPSGIDEPSILPYSLKGNGGIIADVRIQSKLLLNDVLSKMSVVSNVKCRDDLSSCDAPNNVKIGHGGASGATHFDGYTGAGDENASWHFYHRGVNLNNDDMPKLTRTINGKGGLGGNGAVIIEW